MPTVFRVEIFTRDYSFKAASAIEPPVLAFDYLTLEKTKVKATANAEKGDIVNVLDGTGRVVYQGLVDDVERDKTRTQTITLKPLLSLFDVDVSFDRTTYQYAEDLIASIIDEHFIHNSDALQNIPGMRLEVSSHTLARLNLKDNIHNLYEIITKAFGGHGVVTDLEFRPWSGEVMVTIGRRGGDIVIEADLPEVVAKSMVIGDSYGKLNKLTLIDRGDEAQRSVYYLHQSGTISTIDEDRLLPVFFGTEYIDVDEDEDFQAATYSRAYEVLAPQKFDNLIELTIPSHSRILDAELPIGTPASILSGGEVYTSVLTGHEKTQQTTKLLFGMVRVDLTKRLLIERRRSK